LPEKRDRVSEAAIGIDVGGTKTALGIVTADGALTSPRRLANRDAADANALLAAVAAEARALAGLVEPEATLAGIGVGICELVDRDGEIRSSSSIPWTRADVVGALGSLAPVTLEADVRAAALAEAQLGAGRRFSSFVYVTVGTGISHCLVDGGVPYLGAHGIAQLIGSSRVTIPCRSCDSLATAALEDVAGGPALVRRYNGDGRRRVDTAEEVLRKAEDGDPVAARAVDEAATILGSFVALLVNVLDPSGVVVGGGLGSARGAYRETMADAARAAVWSDLARTVPIVPAELGPDAGVVGAGLTALQPAAARV
jgi:glucokinase